MTNNKTDELHQLEYYTRTLATSISDNLDRPGVYPADLRLTASELVVTLNQYIQAVIDMDA